MLTTSSARSHPFCISTKLLSLMKHSILFFSVAELLRVVLKTTYNHSHFFFCSLNLCKYRHKLRYIFSCPQNRHILFDLIEFIVTRGITLRSTGNLARDNHLMFPESVILKRLTKHEKRAQLCSTA